MTMEIKDRLFTVGCKIVREIPYISANGTEHSLVIGYSLEAEGKSKKEVIVLQNVLDWTEIIKKYDAPYITFPLETGWKFFKASNLERCDVLVLNNKANYVNEPSDIVMLFLDLFDQLGKMGLNPTEIKALIDFGLITRAKWNKQNTLHKWHEYLEKGEVPELARLLMVEFMLNGYTEKAVLSVEAMERLIYGMVALPASGHNLALMYMKLLSSRIKEDLQIEEMQGIHQEDMVKWVMQQITVKGDLLDFSPGTGAFSVMSAMENMFTKIHIFEEEAKLSNHLGIYQNLLGTEGYSVNKLPKENSEAPEQGISLVKCQLPVSGHQSVDKVMASIDYGIKHLDSEGLVLIILNQNTTLHSKEVEMVKELKQNLDTKEEIEVYEYETKSCWKWILLQRNEEM